jgi:hypothetical protein
MKRTIIFLIITILCVYGLLANADDFILGSYGYLQTDTSDYLAYLDYLQEANYNSHVCRTNIQDISELVNSFLSSPHPLKPACL